MKLYETTITCTCNCHLEFYAEDKDDATEKVNMIVSDLNTKGMSSHYISKDLTIDSADIPKHLKIEEIDGDN